MRVVSVKVFRNVPKDGARRCRAVVVVEDNQGKEHEVSTGSLLIGKGVNIDQAFSDFVMRGVVREEATQYKRKIIEGLNPFSKTPRFNDSQNLLRDILREAFKSEDADDELLIAGSRILNQIPNTRLKELFPSASDVKLQKIRDKATNILEAQNSLATHEAIEL